MENFAFLFLTEILNEFVDNIECKLNSEVVSVGANLNVKEVEVAQFVAFSND